MSETDIDSYQHLGMKDEEGYRYYLEISNS